MDASYPRKKLASSLLTKCNIKRASFYLGYRLNVKAKYAIITKKALLIRE